MSSPSILKIQHLVAAQRPGYSLTQAFYQDQDVYQQEITQIFLKHWLYAGHVSQIPAAGDYFTVAFDTESVIVTRNTLGEVKAHMNVCRHRGSRICLESSGSQKSLTCPYHAWSYGLNGDLLSARNMPEGFDRSQHGLHQVQVAVLHGLIFICLSDNPPNLNALQRDLAEVFALFGFNAMKLAQKKSYRIAANWKLAVENYQECYHCAPSHPEFAQIHAMAKTPQVFQNAKAHYHRDHKNDPKFKAFDRYFDLAEAGQEGYQYDRNPLLRGSVSGSVGGKAVAPLLGNISAYDGGASELMVGPLSYFLLYDDHVLGYRFLPLSVDECICDVSWFVHEKAEEGKDYHLDQLTWLWDVTTQADKKIIMNNQQGVASRFYQSGPLSDMEHFQQHFLRWYLQTLTS
jgi:phenylpropionate dioxygenase-like ring-hydroxylating dioxygenase large terminal subunit